VARLPTGHPSRPSRRGTRPPQALEVQGAHGSSRQAGPIFDQSTGPAEAAVRGTGGASGRGPTWRSRYRAEAGTSIELVECRGLVRGGLARHGSRSTVWAGSGCFLFPPCMRLPRFRMSASKERWECAPATEYSRRQDHPAPGKEPRPAGAQRAAGTGRVDEAAGWCWRAGFHRTFGGWR
jgi:hypothetical protein